MQHQDTKPYIGVCHGPRCRDYGGEALLKTLRGQGVDACAVDCQSLCAYSPVVRLADQCVLRAEPEDVLACTAPDNRL